MTSAYRGLTNPYTLFGCTQWPVRTADLLTLTPYSGVPSDQCVPRTYKPLHLIRVYPVTSAYRGLSNPYTLFRCTQWPVRTADLLTLTPYSGVPSDQCVPRTYKPLHLIRVYPVTSAYRGLINPYTLFGCTQWPVRTEDLQTLTPYSGVPSDQCVPRTY